MASTSRGLSSTELAEFREIFDLVDKDKGGSISSEELADLMSTLGINASRDEIRTMVSEIDADGNGGIDFDEFNKGLTALNLPQITKDEWEVITDKAMLSTLAVSSCRGSLKP